MPQLVYDIGYSGKALLKTTQVLATGGSVSINYSPIYSTGVWGATFKNVTQKIAYAPNYVTMQANVSFQLTTSLATLLSLWAFTERETPQTLSILPNGIAGYSGSAYCAGCSFSASQDSLVTGQFNGKIGGSVSTFTTTTRTNNDTSTDLSNFINNYTQVYPFWASSVDLADDVLDWNASYSSDVIFVLTCSGAQKNQIAEKVYSCLAPMEASGSFSVFSQNGKDANLIDSYLQRRKACNITLYDANYSNKMTISLKAILFDSKSTDLQTGTNLISRTFNFTALGNTSDAPMNFE